MEIIIDIFFWLTNIVGIFLIILLMLIAIGIAHYKRRSKILFAIAVYFCWPIIFILPFIPRKGVKLPSHIRTLEAFKRKNPVISSIMALSAIVAKSDGNISKEEVSRIKHFVISNFNISLEELNNYSDVFDYGKNNPDDYVYFATVILDYYGNLRRTGILALLIAICIDENGALNQDTDNQLRDIAKVMHIWDYEYETLKSMFSNTANQNVSSQNLEKKYAKVLGVSENADINEVKKAYRKLVKEYHPDKFADGSLPPEHAEFAKQKIVEINEAYEYFKKVHNA
ncbi:hypothetical protein AN639_00825 [Candidatus Epulonipiscium fishelsonii]|uniref:Uncharacterized protein n=1 Tax=Candidatus Epulonipiscium fishelsonii TaxID=77094 RepID=A0ACC8X7V8_9FIRM|nr:hypothetical protein AN396_12330 [Epulopiscium sp. SCG-B11WGA-EpuloA1]ONI41341.1 hypothetical protein AN639_00825 [Epulopiscium sp. SCG-B05WGA-EpuloA1]